MCSRFELNSTAREIKLAFDLDQPPPIPNTSEIRPTDLALSIYKTRSTGLLSWGLEAPWTKQPLINARSETLTEKPSFRRLLASRCVIPATAYFEWRTVDGKAKRKNRISDASGAPLSMAGLKDGDRFTIVTCAPSSDVAHIHSRMPVLLRRDATAAWLSDAPFSEVEELLSPFDGKLAAEEEVPPPPPQGDLFA